MPTYVFRCPKCGHTIESMMSIKDYSSNPKPVCVESGCDGQQEMQTQLQPTGVHFKGTGWTPKSADSWGAPTDIVQGKKR